jgi:hypothetical protein
MVLYTYSNTISGDNFLEISMMGDVSRRRIWSFAFLNLGALWLQPENHATLNQQLESSASQLVPCILPILGYFSSNKHRFVVVIDHKLRATYILV